MSGVSQGAIITKLHVFSYDMKLFSKVQFSLDREVLRLFNSWEFLRSASFILDAPCPSNDYIPIKQVLDLSSLTDRLHAAIFFKTYIQQIEFPSLLTEIYFRVPSLYIRTIATYRIPLSYFNYYQSNSTLIRLWFNWIWPVLV